MIKCFVPHKECRVASGDCFTVGRCLDKCRPKLSAVDANEKLGEALFLLEELTKFVMASSSVTKYVDGSSIEKCVRKSKALLSTFK